MADPDISAVADAAEYRVLARKYRPANFDELIGQEALVRTLTNAIRTGRVAHAFILTGVRGIGKTTTARIIARALNCIGPDGTGGPTPTPCGVCEHCVAIAEDRHVDVIEMDAASRTGIDDVREIIDSVRYRPVTARYKVYIVDEVHMLSRNAFNALLKTLEEPPEHVKFVFATTEIRKVPITVLSRCQRFDLRRLDLETLAPHLGSIAEKEGARIDQEAIAVIARAADGSVRDGLSLLDQVIAQAGIGAGAGTEIGGEQVRELLGLADRSQTLDLLDLVMKGDVEGALALVSEMYRSGADPLVVVQDLMEVVHWLTRLRVTPDAAAGQAISGAERDRAKAMADALPISALGRAWQMLLKGLTELQTAPQPVTALEMLVVRLCYVAEAPTPGDLVARWQAADPAAPAGGPAPQPAPTQRAPTQPAAPSAAPQASAPRPTPSPSDAAPAPAAAPSDPGGDPRPEPPPEATMADSAPAPTAGRGSPALAPRAAAAPQPDGASPQPRSFAEVVALFEEKREGILYTHLYKDVHLVRFEPGRLEIRPEATAPPDLANRVGALLSDWTGARWVVSVSAAEGAPTLREDDQAADAAARAEAAAHPLVRQVLEAFPGASINSVRDLEADLQADLATELTLDPDAADALDGGPPIDPDIDPEEEQEQP